MKSLKWYAWCLSRCYISDHTGLHLPANTSVINSPTFGTFFIQVDAPFETIRYCGFEW